MSDSALDLKARRARARPDDDAHDGHDRADRRALLRRLTRRGRGPGPGAGPQEGCRGRVRLRGGSDAGTTPPPDERPGASRTDPRRGHADRRRAGLPGRLDPDGGEERGRHQADRLRALRGASGPARGGRQTRDVARPRAGLADRAARLGAGDPVDLLLESLSSFLAAVEANPTTWRLVLIPAEGAPQSLRKRIVRRRAKVLSSISAAVSPGSLPGELSEDAELTARVLSASADEYARLLLEDPVRYPAARLLAHARSWLARIEAAGATSDTTREQESDARATAPRTQPVRRVRRRARRRRPSPATSAARRRWWRCCARASSATATPTAVLEVGGAVAQLRRAVGARGARRRRPARRRASQRGDRVAIRLANGIDWVLAFFGAQLLGAVVVPVNTRFTEEEVAYVVEDSGASVHVRAGRAAARRRAGRRSRTSRPEDLAAIFYTSGTTGFPKGAMTSHGNFLTNSENAFRCLSVDRAEGPSISTLVSVPLFHVTGCNSQLIPMLELGGRVEILSGPLDLDGFFTRRRRARRQPARVGAGDLPRRPAPPALRRARRQPRALDLLRRRADRREPRARRSRRRSPTPASATASASPRPPR